MRNFWKWWIVGLLALTPAISAAQSDNPGSKPPDVSTTVDAMLRGIERTATDEEWAALGDAAIAPLLERINDTNRTVIERGRAVTALGNFKTPQAAVALRALLGDTTTPTLLVRKAIQSLNKIEGDGAVDAIAPFLNHASATVREDAIKALNSSDSKARAALEARHKSEPEAHLKQLIQTELQRPLVEEAQR